MGHSVGWSEGNTLVIVIGSISNDMTWIDGAGLPHSDKPHLIERITRPEQSKLHVDVTIDDPRPIGPRVETERGNRTLDSRGHYD